MNCLLCGLLSSTEMQQLFEKPVCMLCASSISSAYAQCSQKPSRRVQVYKLLQRLGLNNIMPTDARLLEIAENATDEQIRGAVLTTKQTIGNPNIGYVAGVLRSERSRGAPKAAEVAQTAAADAPRLEPWEREGFSSEADWSSAQDAFQREKWRTKVGKGPTWADFRKAWLSEAI